MSINKCRLVTDACKQCNVCFVHVGSQIVVHKFLIYYLLYRFFGKERERLICSSIVARNGASVSFNVKMCTHELNLSLCCSLFHIHIFNSWAHNFTLEHFKCDLNVTFWIIQSKIIFYPTLYFSILFYFEFQNFYSK